MAQTFGTEARRTTLPMSVMCTNRTTHQKNRLYEIFEAAGKKQGLEIWKVTQFTLFPVPPEDYGKFSSGDCYIIVYVDYKICKLHQWIGKDSTMDEYGAAALIAGQMITKLENCPHIYRETQNDETDQFKKYFKPPVGIEGDPHYKKGFTRPDGTSGIIYLDGGVDTCIRKTVINEDVENRLLVVKGIKKTIYTKEVPFSWESLTSDDVYIFEIGPNLFRWKGKKANMFEWLESAFICNSIKENEQNGRGNNLNVTCIFEDEQDSPDSLPKELVSAMGEIPGEFLKIGRFGKMMHFPESKVSDQDFLKDFAKPYLYRICDASGEMCVDKIGQSPDIDKNMLDPKDCFLLDNGQEKVVYVWKGTGSTLDEKRQAVLKAREFVREKGYAKCRLNVILEGHESSIFKQFFKKWK